MHGIRAENAVIGDNGQWWEYLDPKKKYWKWRDQTKECTMAILWLNTGCTVIISERRYLVTMPWLDTCTEYYEQSKRIHCGHTMNRHGMHGNNTVIGNQIHGDNAMVGNRIHGGTIIGWWVHSNNTVIRNWIHSDNAVVGNRIHGGTIIVRWVHGDTTIIGYWVHGKNTVIGRRMHSNNTVIGNQW